MEATVQQVIQVIIDQFAREEAGNRVTNNNMFALKAKVDMAFDGKVTLDKPENKEEK